MIIRRKSIDKETARQLRAELYDEINRGELTIQEAVKKMRRVSRLNQAEFAAHSGVSAKVIKEIERGVGNPTVNTLNVIGKFFGLEVAFVRSEKLQRPGSRPSLDAMPHEAAMPAAVIPHSAIDASRRLMKELEDIKKMVTPSQPLHDTFTRMTEELGALRNAQKLIAQADIHQIQGAAMTELDRAMIGIDTELKAVREARKIIESAEKIQRTIEPPAALVKWLADIEAAKKLLEPLDKMSKR